MVYYMRLNVTTEDSLSGNEMLSSGGRGNEFKSTYLNHVQKLLHHLFQHVLQSLRLQVDNKLLLLPSVQIVQQSPVTGIIEVLDTDGTDLPVVLSRPLHDGLQDGIACRRNPRYSLTKYDNLLLLLIIRLNSGFDRKGSF